METKFTRGEWFIQEGNGQVEILCRRFPAGIDSIAVIHTQFKDEVSLANAKIIAAAPEMFDTLYNIANGTPPATEREAFIFVELAKTMAENTIKKATE